MKRTWWKKFIITLAITLTAVLGIQTTAYAGQWRKDAYGWWYQQDDGTYPWSQWRWVNGSWYYFNRSGYMETGWQLINGEWYFLYDDGSMAANEWVGDYYLTGSGAMATNRWIGNYWVGSDGRYIETNRSAQLTVKGDSPDINQETQPVQNDNPVTMTGVVHIKSNLRIENPSLPENLNPGQSFGLYGIVLSDHNIKKVTGYILDSNRNEIMSKTDCPNTKSYDLNGVNNQGPINVALCFNQLSPGNYYYVLEAQDEQIGTILIDHEFSVNGATTGNVRIVADAANRVTCAYGGYEGHWGTDIGWRQDESQNIVYPHSPGTVVAVEKNWTSAMGYNNMASYGNYVVIKHSDKYWTRYAHLDSVNVSVGQEVTYGTPLGIMGATGNVTGRHVHVELITNLRNNTRIDIGPYLNSALPE